MAKFVTFFSYTGQTWDRMIGSPGDRTAAISATAEAVGASVESLHFMLGAHDGMVVLSAPDSRTAAAVITTAMGSGAFRAAETHELFTEEDLADVLGKASDARSAYRPPGS